MISEGLGGKGDEGAVAGGSEGDAAPGDAAEGVAAGGAAGFWTCLHRSDSRLALGRGQFRLSGLEMIENEGGNKDKGGVNRDFGERASWRGGAGPKIEIRGGERALWGTYQDLSLETIRKARRISRLASSGGPCLVAKDFAPAIRGSL